MRAKPFIYEREAQMFCQGLAGLYVLRLLGGWSYCDWMVCCIVEMFLYDALSFAIVQTCFVFLIKTLVRSALFFDVYS